MKITASDERKLWIEDYDTNSGAIKLEVDVGYREFGAGNLILCLKYSPNEVVSADYTYPLNPPHNSETIRTHRLNIESEAGYSLKDFEARRNTILSDLSLILNDDAVMQEVRKRLQ